MYICLSETRKANLLSSYSGTEAAAGDGDDGVCSRFLFLTAPLSALRQNYEQFL